MEAKEQLIRMLKIQELAREIDGARELIGRAPERIEESEGRFRDRNTEYVALRDRYDELESDRSERSDELSVLEESKKKFMADLMQVQNQREYSAILKEIDAVKVRISEHEDTVLKDMEELESLKPKLESFAAHIQQERTQVEEERRQVESEAEETRQRMDRCQAERDTLEAELPAGLLGNLRRIEQMRQGVFLARVEDGLCQACYVRVRPQAFQEIKLASRIHACSQCRRFLYFEPALKPETPAETPAETQTEPQTELPARTDDPSGIEAMDGGTV